MNKRAVVILPTYNEKSNITKTLEEIDAIRKHSKWHIVILVVDDNSPDGTAEVVKKIQKSIPDIYLIQGKKEGLGRAYQRGFRYAIDNLNPYVLIEKDADGQHDPTRLPAFLDEVSRGADLVLGSRYITGGSIPQSWGIHRKFFSVVGNIIVRFGFMNFSIKDWTTGYRAIRVWLARELLPDMGKYHGYVFQIAFLDKAVKLGAKVHEIPLVFHERNHGQSKIASGQYIFNIISYIATHSSFVKFAVVGFIGFLIDFSVAALLIAGTSLTKPVANMISAEVAIFSNFIMNNFWSFRHKQIHTTSFGWIKKFVIFNAISIGSIIIQGVGLYLALKFFGDTTYWGIPSWIIYKAGIIGFIILPYSYVLYNKIIWKKK